MPMTTQIIYQPYHLASHAALRAGTPVACRTPEEGMRRAERALSAGLVAGADVVRVHHDEDADEFGDPEFIGRLGQTPDPV
jgi:hypothetical protein